MRHLLLQADARRIPLADKSVHCVVTSPPYWNLRDYQADKQIGLEPTPYAFVDAMVAVFREVYRVLRDDGTLWLNLGDSYGGDRGNKTPAPDNKNRVLGGGSVHGLARDFDFRKQLVGIPWRVALALQSDGWYLRSDIIWAKKSPMPESVTDRPTKAHEYLFLLTKGQSRSRAIAFSDLQPEFVHFGRNLRAKNSHMGTVGLCVEIAATIFDLAQEEHGFRLPPFYSEEWKNGPEGTDSNLVAGLPPKHRAAAYAARFLDGDTSTKEFLGEVHRLWRDLAQADHLLVGRRLAEGSLSPSVFVDGDGTIAINDAGEIRKVDFSHGHIIVTVSTTCNYFYDADAVRETPKGSDPRVRRSSEDMAGESIRNTDLERYGTTRGKVNQPCSHPAGANLRTVWRLSTDPWPGAHFATYPRKLVEPCIKAGTSEKGCCPTCGSPWRRVTERSALKRSRPNDYVKRSGEDGTGNSCGNTVAGVAVRTLGWEPTCPCPEHTPVPCTVLDPFNGSGTTGVVALALGRNYVGLDLNRDYLGMARRRIERPHAPVERPAEDEPLPLFSI